MYNNREIATLIWFDVFMVCALCVPSIREPIVRSFLTLFSRTLLLSFGIVAAYTACVCVLLATVDLWHTGMIKDTVVWFFFASTFVVGDFITSKDDPHVFKKVFFDNVKVIILAEFILNTYTMSLVAELVFIPFVTLTVTLNAVAKLNEEHKPAVLLTDYILGVSGLLLFGYSAWEAVDSYGTINTWDTFRNFIFPPLMSLLFSPLVFFMVLFSVYEMAFVGLKTGPDKTQEVARYAKWRLVSHFGLRLRKLREFRQHSFHYLSSIQTKEDVDQLLDSL